MTIQTSAAAQHAQTIADICRFIETADTPPNLDELAARAGLSPFHFHRVFKAQTGLTPKAYAAAHRAGRMRDTLTKSRTVTEAIYGAGFSSSSRFYGASAKALGMAPSQYREGG